MSGNLGNICTWCKGKESSVLYLTYDIFGNNYTINKCNNCKAYFLSPFPSEEILAKAYDDSYYGEKSEKFNPYLERVLDFFRGNRAGYVSRFLENNSKVLDIGCGNGRFLLSLLRYGGYELYGTELEGKSADRASRIPQIKLKKGALGENDFSKETFDVITLFHVFEHLAEPERTIDIISKILKKEGVLVMSFPNIDSIQSRIFKGRWLHLDPPRHLFFFTPKDFIELMKNRGFKLIRQKYFSAEQNPYGMVQSILNVLCEKRELLFERLKGNKSYGKEYPAFIVFLQKIFFVFAFPFFVLTDFIASLFRKGATAEFTFRKAEKFC